MTERQLFHAASWPTKLVLGPLLARVGTGGGSMPSGTGRAGNPFLAGDDRAAELAEHAASRAARELLPAGVGRRTGAGRLDGHDPLRPHRPGRRRLAGLPLADRPPPVPPRVHAPDGRSGRRRRPRPARGRRADRCRPAAPPTPSGPSSPTAPAKTRLFLERLPVTGTVDPWHAPNPFLAAEQSLRFGHPFHPAPKASRGFTPPISTAYAPELGASFPLHWLAVDPALAGRAPAGHRPVARPAAGAVPTPPPPSSARPGHLAAAAVPSLAGRSISPACRSWPS